MELIMLLLGLAVGIVAGLAWACWKLGGKEGAADAARFIVTSGPGPWRPPQ